MRADQIDSSYMDLEKSYPRCIKTINRGVVACQNRSGLAVALIPNTNVSIPQTSHDVFFAQMYAIGVGEGHPLVLVEAEQKIHVPRIVDPHRIGMGDDHLSSVELEVMQLVHLVVIR